MANTPPKIFSQSRSIARRKRMLAAASDATFLRDEMIDDVIERLAFLRHEPENALILGDTSSRLGNLLAGKGANRILGDIIPSSDHLEIDLEQPLPFGPYDFIACLGLLDTVNDLPGALIHLNRALASGGLAIASFVGAGSLATLRRIMLAADGERPAPRIHPHVDIQAASDLIQRAGWSYPVVDSHTMRVRYLSLQRLVQDLREQGLGNVLAMRTPYLGKSGYARALDAFAAEADDDGRVTETFEIITITGRRR